MMDWFFFAFAALLILILISFWGENLGHTENLSKILGWISDVRRQFTHEHQKIFVGVESQIQDVKFIALQCREMLFAGHGYLQTLRDLESCLREQRRYCETRKNFLRIFIIRISALLFLAILGRAFIFSVYSFNSKFNVTLDRIFLCLAGGATYLLLFGLRQMYPLSWFYSGGLTKEAKTWILALFNVPGCEELEGLGRLQQEQGIDLRVERQDFLCDYSKEQNFKQENFLRTFFEYVPAIELIFFMVPPFLILAFPLRMLYL